MSLKDYLIENFPGLVLKPSLYFQWDKRIHFEFAKGLHQIKETSDELNPTYLQTVYEQALSLFHELFSENDELFLVLNVYQYKNYKKRSKRKIKIFQHYIKNKDVLFHLRHETLPYAFDDEEDAEEKCTSRFYIQCRKNDIRYSLLIKAICHRDFASLKPRLENPYGLYAPDVFFINCTKNIIFFIYDDRGCEVIAKDFETLRPVYEKYRDWLDESALQEMDDMFIRK